eukprot:2286145-Prymnesium_polylepis.1
MSCVCEGVGLFGRWVCGLVSSPAVVPVRCPRAVYSVESRSSRARLWRRGGSRDVRAPAQSSAPPA